MRRVNTVENNGTGTSFLFYRNDDDEPVADWLEDEGIQTAGKTGTAEFCDNLSQEKGWCTEEKILNGEVLPTHSWYVGYAPFDKPEIVVVAFVYNGGEGSQWSAPIVRDIIAAYYGVDQYEGQAILPESLIPDSVKAARQSNAKKEENNESSEDISNPSNN